MSLFDKAWAAAHRWQNTTNLAALVIAVVGLVLMYFGYLPDVYSYVLAAILIILLLLTKFWSAKLALQFVWRCPQCGAHLPIRRSVKKGQARWLPQHTKKCPQCKSKID